MTREIIVKIIFDDSIWEEYDDVCDEIILEDAGMNDLKIGVGYEIIKQE